MIRGALADTLPLWGGVECTVNRIGDVFRDQTKLTGHHDRLSDLEHFAALGVQKLRYPVLWERTAPDKPGEYDWAWSDERLGTITRLGMAPIVGLLHHGSGPAYTSLIDDDFPSLFADYARAVAERYPDVLDWTPVNEPLTTARFSALYGHWYPHARDERLFWQALLNQIDATRLAMQAIREVNFEARLIQTEDLGETYSIDELRDVAKYYNDRRWLTWDLLCGRVVSGHPMWRSVVASGLADRAREIAQRPCTPDIIGINHYITSDRYLDRDLARGPMPDSGFHDVPAARVLDRPVAGLPVLLHQAWLRYGLPLAMTECHIGCTRDEQMRWLAECWQACAAARDAGIDVEALTVWALAGSVDWDSLLTEARGHFEAGAFEVHGDGIRPTALVTLLDDLRRDDLPGHDPHPVFASPGWWCRPSRTDSSHAQARPVGSMRRPLLITGASGTLGRAFAGACNLRGLKYILTDRATLSIDDDAQVRTVLDSIQPWAVINAAGWVRIDDAELDAALCHRANGAGAITLARACDARRIACMQFSSDQVFDGESVSAYDERDVPHPINVYGTSKLAAEQGCLEFEGAIVVRTAAFFSPYDPHNFAMGVERMLRCNERHLVSADHVVTPTYVPHLVNTCLDLLIDAQTGLWHLSNREGLSWAAFAHRIASGLNLNSNLIVPTGAASLGWTAPRPRDVRLASVRGRMLPPLETALAHHFSVRSQQQQGLNVLL